MSEENNNNKKRSMKKQPSQYRKSPNAEETGKSTKGVLLELYYDRKTISKVDLMLDEGKSIPYIHDYLISKGYELSQGTVYNYRDKRNKSITEGIPLVQILEGRKQGNVKNIKHKEVNLTQGQPNGLTTIDGGKKKKDQEVVDEDNGNGNGNGGGNGNKSNKIFNDIEVLDKMIEVGTQSIQHYDFIDPVTLTKIIDAKNKITGNQLQGMTVAGLRELKLAQEAKALAIQNVIYKYIEEDKIDEVMQALEKAEDEFKKELEVTSQGQDLLSAIDRAGIEF